MYKRQIMKVSEVRNSEATITDLRQRVDTLFIEIQEGRDPRVIAQQEKAKQVDDLKLIEAKRSLRDMVYGSPLDIEGEFLPDGFIAELRSSERYLRDIQNKCEMLLAELFDLPLHTISAEQVKTVYLKKSRLRQDSVKWRNASFTFNLKLDRVQI